MKTSHDRFEATESDRKAAYPYIPDDYKTVDYNKLMSGAYDDQCDVFYAFTAQRIAGMKEAAEIASMVSLDAAKAILAAIGEA